MRAMRVVCVLLLVFAAGYGKTLRLQMHKTTQPSRYSRYGHLENWTVRQEKGGGDSNSTEDDGHYRLPLLGGATTVGEYYVTIKLGGQLARVQVDTGSSTLAVPMKECKTCLKTSHRYSLDGSTNAKAKRIGCASDRCKQKTCDANLCPVCSPQHQCCAPEDSDSCAFFLKYGDGSGAQGLLVEDMLEWGGVTVPVTFGGILKDSKDFERPSVDGILGMAYESLACNPSCVVPPFDVMVREKVVEKNIFTLCMRAAGGTLLLGGYDADMAKSEPEYEPLIEVEDDQDRRYYQLGLDNQILVGDSKIEFTGLERAIVDSGTTLLVLPKAAFGAIVEVLRDKYCHIPDLCARNSWFVPAGCVAIDDETLKKMPTLTFPLKHGVRLELRPEDYMLEFMKDSMSLRCVGIMAIDTMSIQIIFGNTLNMRYLTIYDREHDPPRIGFAEADESCGGMSGCANLKSCTECKADLSCVYDYHLHVCGDRSEHDSVIPYPYCHGRTCVCNGQRVVLFVLGGLFMGALVSGLMIWAFRRRRARAVAYEQPLFDDSEYEW